MAVVRLGRQDTDTTVQSAGLRSTRAMCRKLKRRTDDEHFDAVLCGNNDDEMRQRRRGQRPDCRIKPRSHLANSTQPQPAANQLRDADAPDQ